MSVLTTFHRGVEAQLRSVGAVDSPELIKAATVLTRQIRRVLSVSGSGSPSAPGQAPRKQSGKLAKSVRQGVVGDHRRVAVTRFTAPILEAGVNSSKSRRGKTRRLVIAARPFMQRGLAAAQSEMTAVLVKTAQDRLALVAR